MCRNEVLPLCPKGHQRLAAVQAVFVLVLGYAGVTQKPISRLVIAKRSGLLGTGRDFDRAGCFKINAALGRSLMTSFLPFATPVHCTVVQRRIVLSGVAAPISGRIQVMRKACSNAGDCMAKFGPLEKLDGCLLHSPSQDWPPKA
jgi:hypothetical protein